MRGERWWAGPGAVCLLTLALAGCGGKAAPVASPEDEARQTLDRALQGWQKGDTVAAMKEGKPSILVADPSWEKGAALSKFEVQGPGKPSGAERTFSVKLWVADAGGKESEQVVDYKVGTQPILTAFRSLF